MQNFPPEFRARNNERGLTLIEVLIAAGLLAMLSYAIFQANSRAFTLTARMSKEATDMVALTLSLQTFESDINQVYSPLLEPQAQAANKDPSTFWSEPVRSDGIRRARFQGGKEKLSFISNGNRRVEQDSPQSEFQKVVWEIEKGDSGFTLYRTTDWDAFAIDEPKQKPQRVALLEKISSAQFRYYRAETKSWEDQWDSESSFARPNARYPDLISLQLEVPDPENANVQIPLEVKVRPHLTLNFGKPDSPSLPPSNAPPEGNP